MAFYIMSMNATACSLAPEAYDLEVWLKETDPTQVVLVGKVVVAEDLNPLPRMISQQRIQFEVIRLWRGELQLPIVAAIGVARPTGTSCDGLGNLKMEVGQTWLLVGDYREGQIRLSSLKSKWLKNDVLPAETLKLLEEERQ